jgi:hypothetical protein
MVAMPAERNGCARWLHAARLILNQADVAAVSRQVHLALFYDVKLDFRAMDVSWRAGSRTWRTKLDR